MGKPIKPPIVPKPFVGGEWVKPKPLIGFNKISYDRFRWTVGRIERCFAEVRGQGKQQYWAVDLQIFHTSRKGELRQSKAFRIPAHALEQADEDESVMFALMSI